MKDAAERRVRPSQLATRWAAAHADLTAASKRGIARRRQDLVRRGRRDRRGCGVADAAERRSRSWRRRAADEALKLVKLDARLRAARRRAEASRSCSTQAMKKIEDALKLLKLVKLAGVRDVRLRGSGNAPHALRSSHRRGARAAARGARDAAATRCSRRRPARARAPSCRSRCSTSRGRAASAS